MSLQKFFTSDSSVRTMVILNLILIFIGGFYKESYAFICIDAFFTIFFMIEAILKIRELSWRRYWGDSWNRFDFIVTVIALPSLVSLFGTFGLSTNVILSFRAIRVVRAIKSIRVIHFLPNIDSVLRGVVMAVKASVFVVVGFVLLLFLVSIITTTIFGDIVPEYFGNPGLSLYNTFRLFSIEGWYEIPDTIVERSGVALSVFAKVYFSLLLFVGGILGMSLINSIFVDAAVSDNNDDLQDQVNRLESKIDELTRLLQEKENDR